MRILLLNPPDMQGENFIREGRCTQEEGIWSTVWPPISLVYIGTLLKEDGHEVKIVDCAAEHIGINQIKQIIGLFHPDAAIWSTGTPSIESDLKIAQIIKKINPSIATAVFGTHVTALDAECMHGNDTIDAIIRNEPEYTARDWVAALTGKIELKSMSGITYKDSDGHISHNPPREYIFDLDRLPFPDWSLVETASYKLPLKGDPFLMVMPLRGCPFSCIFCTCQTYYGHKLRLRSVESLVSEIQHNIGKFNVKNFFIWAETFTVNRSFTIDLCRAFIKNGLDIKWVCNSRVDTVDAELLNLMHEAGCWMISYGIESLNHNILAAARKNISLEQIKDAVILTKKSGIMASGHVMFGLPGETMDSALATKKGLKDLNLDFAQFYCAVPFPGSELYDVAMKSGWMKWKNFRDFRQEKAVMDLPTITAEKVEKVRKQAVREFYLRLSIIRKLAAMLQFKGLWRAMTSILKLIRGAS